ncbi:VWA domain-containing protein [Malonomonas rubra]|uniref:vWA domain-containing protein n=1 Tax=Malonomonas rubra TaxID=57040 RepID=UPI0026EF1F49|nr:VWA domain-containing protein [Malonomonas rubra]
MLHFIWPWMFLLLPIPLLIRKFLSPLEKHQGAALQVPFIEDFYQTEKSRGRVHSKRWLALATWLCWLLLVAASARPEWLGDPIQLPVSGRDLLLSVDLSGSMEAADFEINGDQVDRLTAAKWVAGDFIERRTGDRIGLILFGRHAYLQTPLTFDRKTVRTLLEESAIGLAGKETAIGDAIGLALKRLKGQPESSQVLILLTDGANTAGEIDPLKAAELAKKAGLKIYTIGIGADEIEVRSFFGTQKINPSTDLDEKTLRQIAQLTGGQYFRARDTEELAKIYQLLDKLEPVEKETQSYRPTTALFHWPLGVVCALAMLLAVARLKPGLKRSAATKERFSVTGKRGNV